jgi:hypothetical protein
VAARSESGDISQGVEEGLSPLRDAEQQGLVYRYRDCVMVNSPFAITISPRDAGGAIVVLQKL